jgi:hypothetical protein
MKKLRQEPRNKFDAETTPASKKRGEKKRKFGYLSHWNGIQANPMEFSNGLE